jgi:hypothetical protein
MDINTLPKDEMVSHIAEIVSTQDSSISTLKAERKILLTACAILFTIITLF